jgi:nucleotide-binding universal stress UspA family protein
MKTIIATTDFSAAADNAALYAAKMAAAIHANLLLLHVYQLPVTYMEVPLIITEEEMVKLAQERLTNFKEELAVRTDFKIIIETKVKTGVFFSELKAFCEAINPYSIVMGSKGTTAAERLFFGSHSIHAMKHLSWPLITVPPEMKFTSIKKIGLACDFENVTDTIPVEEIKTLAIDLNAELHILNTGKKRTYNPNLVFESGRLQEMMSPLKSVFHFTSNPDVDEGTIDFSERNHIDLLLVFSKHHGFIDSITHKNHSKQLVLHSHIPVMVFHHELSVFKR